MNILFVIQFFKYFQQVIEEEELVVGVEGKSAASIIHEKIFGTPPEQVKINRIKPKVLAFPMAEPVVINHTPR